MSFKQDIIKKLENIYHIRKTWNGAPGPFDQKSIKKRESIFIQQSLLESVLSAINRRKI